MHGFFIHAFSALYFTLKAHKGPTVGAVIPGHALHVLKNGLYGRASLGHAHPNSRKAVSGFFMKKPSIFYTL